MTAILKVDAKVKALTTLKLVSYTHYPINYQEKQANVKALINSSSEVNMITPIYIAKLGFNI